MNEEILKLIREKGLLLEKEVFDLINSFSDARTAQNFLENIEKYTGQKLITKSVLNKNFEFVQNIVRGLPGEEKRSIESVFVKLGLKLEITKESSAGVVQERENTEKEATRYAIFYANTKADKKIEVGDFIDNFRSRYQQMQRILMQRADLTNLATINKLSGGRQQISVIGIVKQKRITKNRNFIIILEDLTGEIAVLVKEDRKEVFDSANELQLDDVVAVKGAWNGEILFVTHIYYPDSYIHEKARFEREVCVAFMSDIHCGSSKHLKKSMESFLEWINSRNETAEKIRFIFFVGDNVDGVGIFPGQERTLELKSMKEQYNLLADYLRRIPKRITMFMCPGQHDATRVAEPQPLIDRKYAESLYAIENLVLVTNPAMIKLFEGKREFKILMYHGASIHYLINEIQELRESKAHNSPAKAIRHMLKRRHLSPTHSSSIYIPNPERDPLMIYDVPDVLCTGEVHRPDVENYNGVLIITGSCWQAQTDFEEKVGNIPDPGKVPVLNLKTRELKIFDFLAEEDVGFKEQEGVGNEY